MIVEVWSLSQSRRECSLDIPTFFKPKHFVSVVCSCLKDSHIHSITRCMSTSDVYSKRPAAC